ncbi:MAG: hypothetical protein CSA75_02235 [Sorangium cellulosum]|nr:MAG: hypothetical protein CSA75_02235 [Sorangium cellulosum]
MSKRLTRSSETIHASDVWPALTLPVETTTLDDSEGVKQRGRNSNGRASNGWNVSSIHPATVRFLVVACVVLVILIVASMFKRRAAYQAIPEAKRVIPAGSLLVVPSISTPPSKRPADLSAKVSEGPPRMYHLDPAHTNRSPYVGPTQPVVEQTVEIGSPALGAVALMPNGNLIIGTLSGMVLGVTSSGKTIFKTHLRDRVYAAPLRIGQRIFIGSDGNQFVSLAGNGDIRWSLETGGDADTAATPTPDHGLVFASEKTVYFVRQDGSVVWRVKGERKFFSSPAVAHDGTIYIGSQDNRFYAITRVGTVRFQIDLGQDVDCAPAIDDNGMVYVGTDGGKVVAVDPELGQVAWTTQLGGHVRGGVTLTRSHDVVVGVYGPSPRVVTLRGDTGEQLWSFAVPGPGTKEYGVHGSPVEDAHGNLYFGAQDDAVYSLTSAGQLRWKFATGGDVDVPVALVAEGVLIALSDDGKLYRLAEQSKVTN